MNKIISFVKKQRNSIFIYIIFILFLLISCKKPVPFGLTLYPIEKSISYQRGVIKLVNEDLYVRYLITNYDDQIINSDDDLIFFFHGIGRNELQWIDNDGFAKQFLNIINSNPDFKKTPVISISFGMASFIINDSPFPFNANLESIFINDLIPYFQKTLNKHGKVYLIGHSLGGYNALSLGFRHPELFPVVTAISPFISTESPFDKNFDKSKSHAKKNIIFVKFIKKALIYTFKNKKKWDEYNAFNIVSSNNKKHPYIIISSSQSDLPEFSYSIKMFLKKLEEKKINYKYYITPGNHQKPKIDKLLLFLIKKINNKKKINF